MTVISGVALDDGGLPISGIVVKVELVTSSATTPGLTSAGELIVPRPLVTGADGAWSFDLTPNDSITPPGTYYKISEGANSSLVSIPDAGGPYTIQQTQVTSPPSPSAPGMTGLRVAAAGVLAGTRPEVNFQAGSGISVSATDDSATDSVDVLIGFTGTSGPSPSDAVARGTSYGEGAVVGVSPDYSRGDHLHGTPPLPATATTAAPGLVQLDGVATDMQPVGKAAPGASGLAADGRHVHPDPPHVFRASSYGAEQDLRCVIDASVSAGNVVTCSTSAPFTPSMVGMPFALKGGLTSGQTTLSGTFSAYVSSTQMQLSVSATATASGLTLKWGTDDTAALQSMLDAAMAYDSPFGVDAVCLVDAPKSGYGSFLAGGPKNSSTLGNALYNSVLTIELRSDRLPGKQLMIRGEGGDGAVVRHWNSDYPFFGTATWFSSFTFAGQAAQATTDPHSVSNGGNPSVLGGPTGKFGYGTSATNPSFNNVTVTLQGMQIMTAHSSSGWTLSPFNFHGTARAHLERCSFGTDGVVQYYKGAGGSGGNTDFNSPATFSGGISIGGLMPAAGNNASSSVRDCAWNGGYTYGPLLAEHSVCDGANLSIYSWMGLGFAGDYGDGGVGTGSLHAIKAGQWTVEGCSGDFIVFGAGSGGRGPYVEAILDTESSRAARDTTSGTSLNALRGSIVFKGSVSVPALTFPTACVITLDENAPGVAASPPALVANAAVMNSTGRWATLFLSGGSGLTTVQVSDLMWGPGGAQTPSVSTPQGFDFTASGTIPPGTQLRVAPGAWIKVNGTGTPTLPSVTWRLD